jgi:hypothetical protein
MMKKITKGKLSFTQIGKGEKIRIKLGDKICTIRSLDLFGVAFEMTKDPDMRAQLMPLRTEPVMKFKKVHTVAVRTDMKAGETLQFTCVIDVPTYVMDGMRDIVSREVPGSGPILDELIGKPELSTKEPIETELKDLQ